MHACVCVCACACCSGVGHGEGKEPMEYRKIIVEPRRQELLVGELCNWNIEIQEAFASVSIQNEKVGLENLDYCNEFLVGHPVSQTPPVQALFSVFRTLFLKCLSHSVSSLISEYLDEVLKLKIILSPLSIELLQPFTYDP